MSNPPTFNFHSEELGKIAESFARNRAKEKPEALQSRVAEEMTGYTQTRNAVVDSMCAAEKMCDSSVMSITGGSELARKLFPELFTTVNVAKNKGGHSL